MSQKEKSGKAMPILSIVFFGVSLLLFASKAVVTIVYRILSQRAHLLHIVVAESGKVVAFAFPAVLFIVCAGVYLNRSPKYRKLLGWSYLLQTLSALILAGRLIYVQYKNGFANTSVPVYMMIAVLALIAVLCLVAAVLEMKGKRKKALIIVISCCGFLLACIFASTFLVPLFKNFSYFLEHIAMLLSSVLSALLYALALIFYYVAFLFTAFYKEAFPKPAEKVKVVMKAK